ncbi:hypothetical protein OROGR_015117 [Orobanche gracilis]
MIEKKSESVEETESEDFTNKSKRVGIRREPSFSGWCDEAGIRRPAQLKGEEVNKDDFDFRLPLVHPHVSTNKVLDKERLYFSNLRQTMEHTGDTDCASTNGLIKQNESFVPFDVEKDHDSERYASTTGGLNHDDYHPASRKEEENLISVADVLKTLFFILVWYTFSTFLTLYNKSLLGDDMGKFPAPLLMNTVHFTMQALLSRGITWFWSDRFHPSVMSWKDYFVRVVPTALSTAMDVNLSNASLVFISVTFATMCKSASPIFLLLFAFAFSRPINIWGAAPPVLHFTPPVSVVKETEFEFWGFIFVTLAAVMSGFRWTMTQILLQGLKNPLTLMSYVTPVMAIATALLSLMLDPWHEFRRSDYFNSSWHIMRSSLLMLFGGTLAFFMVLTEYILVSVTSAVTVTIAGVVKEAVTILVAVLYFHDEFTWLKGVGLLTIMVGVSLFNLYKYKKLQKVETTGSLTDGANPKYVILGEMDAEEEDA